MVGSDHQLVVSSGFDLKSVVSNGVPVRVRPAAFFQISELSGGGSIELELR
jgi:hypothetical protein